MQLFNSCCEEVLFLSKHIKKELKRKNMATNLLEKIQNSEKDIEYHRPTLSKEELQTVLDCLVDDLVDSGSVVEKFEKEIKSTFSHRNVISVNSLFSAYHLSLLSLGVSPEDRVILSAFAPLPAYYAILLLGAKPVPVDLGKASFHMDPVLFQKIVRDTLPRVILLDHTYGALIDSKLYSSTEIPIIEDYSEALGADSQSIAVGKQGQIGIFGLSPTHVITTGNGAIITTQVDTIAEMVRNLKYPPNPKKKSPAPIRYDYNMLDFQAAIGVEQISKLGVIIERKRKIAQIYLQALLTAGHETFFRNVGEDQYNRFPVVIKKSPEEVERYFKSLRIGIDKTTPEPIFKLLELPGSEFPNAERLFQRGHCIPIYPNLTRDNVSRIANSLKGLY